MIANSTPVKINPNDNQHHDSNINKTVTLLLTATIITIISFLVRRTSDSDIWFHISIGRDILNHFVVPSIDHFTVAAYGRPYHDSHWLFQVIIALADKLGGMSGVELVMIALWGSTLFCCYRTIRRWASPDVSCLLVFVVTIACNDRFFPRPELVTFVMVTLYYYLLQEKKYKTNINLILFCVLQVIWSNSHGLFVIGPFMAGCYLVNELYSKWKYGDGDLSFAIKLLVILMISTLITPFGLDGWRYALLLSKEVGQSSPALFKRVLELSPTFGKYSRFFPAFWFYFILLILFVITSVPTLFKKHLSYSRLLIVIALLIVSVSAKRNIPLFALIAAPFIAENVFRNKFKLSFPPIANISISILLGIISIFPVSDIYYEMFNMSARFGLGPIPEAYSSELPNYLNKIHFTGQIYAPDYLGGYCLYYGYKPLIDGRWEVYDANLLQEIGDARFEQNLWAKIISTYNVQGAIVSYGDLDTNEYLQRLNNDKRFQKVYEDNAVSFWLRTSS